MCFLPSMVAYRKMLRAASHTYLNCHFCYFVLEISHPTEADLEESYADTRIRTQSGWMEMSNLALFQLRRMYGTAYYCVKF